MQVSYRIIPGIYLPSFGLSVLASRAHCRCAAGTKIMSATPKRTRLNTFLVRSHLPISPHSTHDKISSNSSLGSLSSSSLQ